MTPNCQRNTHALSDIAIKPDLAVLTRLSATTTAANGFLTNKSFLRFFVVLEFTDSIFFLTMTINIYAHGKSLGTNLGSQSLFVL